MSKVIYKFPINVREVFMMPGYHEELLISRIQVPQGAEFLSVDNQREDLVSWFKVDPDEKLTESKSFVLLATGATISDEAHEHLEERFRFVKTVLFSGGNFVIHVYKGVDDA
ncbi:Uncharacterised protein [Ectopseudomonas mendocina]|uniref:DUF7352 domain-containing protein n=1 Tax=Ectopseudomonas mendocina TaxID=300 RepID=A0A379PRT6_ECTME|nr:hypothetical protein [Pseudomonas mendocina]SUE95862.1 Uncharacterised protein [Pseudomonas mendocina]